MPRCRVVSPDVVRLFLVDVHRRELESVRELLAKEKATPEDVALAAAKVTQAERDADWIDIRKVLNAGERRAMFARMYIAGLDGRLRANPLQQAISRTTAYLLDWSMVDFKGKKIPIMGLPVEAVQSALDALDPDTVAEIGQAVLWHEEQMEQEKNVLAETGADAPPMISASVV